MSPNEIRSKYESSNSQVEIERYIDVFTDSSNRVRRVYYIIAIVSILMLIGYRSQHESGWTNSQSNNIRLAKKIRENCESTTTWEDLRSCLPEDLYKELMEKRTERRARIIELSEGRTTEELAELSDDFFKLSLSRIWMQQVPFLGINFDINDLGVFGGITMTLLYAILLFSFSRQYENLQLSTWKMRRLCKDLNSYNDRGSLANYLYHALAMAQMFSVPPTLIRTRPRIFWIALFLVLLLLPAGVQYMVGIHDISTYEIAVRISPRAADLGRLVHMITLSLTAVFMFGCLVYILKTRRQWKEIFYFLNPKLDKGRRSEKQEQQGAQDDPSPELHPPPAGKEEDENGEEQQARP